MNKRNAPVIEYGPCSNLLVRQDKDNNVIYLSGVGKLSNQWVHPTTQRAVHHLWFSLTHLLFPEKANVVTSMAGTAMISAPQPGITSHFEVKRDPQTNSFVVVGWIGEHLWSFHMNGENAHQLWTALDRMLYPAGWEGTTTTHRPPSKS